MRSYLLWLMLVVVVLAPAMADAQGYYKNTLRRNPFTGRWEIVPSAASQSGASGPYRDQRTFSGEAYNPYDGTLARSAVRRNPYTGRLEVQNEYYNPYTGARVTQGTRFNPLTGRYETVNQVQPPTNPIPSGTKQPEADAATDVEAPPATNAATAPPAESTTKPTTANKPIIRPRIIENQFPSDPPPR